MKTVNKRKKNRRERVIHWLIFVGEMLQRSDMINFIGKLNT